MSGTDVIVYTGAWEEDAKQQQQEFGSRATAFISTKGGVFSIGEQQVGQELIVVVIDELHENTWYHEKFDPNRIQSPKCFAFGRSKEDMAPHDATFEQQLMDDGSGWFEPQANSCKECPLNVFGSSDTGRGKACQNRLRLAMLPAGMVTPVPGTRGQTEIQLFDSKEHFTFADVSFMKLPVTSVKSYGEYVNKLAASVRRGARGVITRVFLTPDGQTQYKVNFELIEPLPDDYYPVIMARREGIMAQLEHPYGPPREEEQRPPARGVAGLRGMVRR